MTPICTTEMEPLTKRRYWFAMSSFARMYTPSKVTQEMSDFCLGWALHEDEAPLDCLNHVDRYFGELWKKNLNV
jgi:hypothetical protein